MASEIKLSITVYILPKRCNKQDYFHCLQYPVTVFQVWMCEWVSWGSLRIRHRPSLNNPIKNPQHNHWNFLILISPFMYRSHTASCIRLCSHRTFDGTRQYTQVRNEGEERKRWQWLLQSHNIIFNIKILFFGFKKFIFRVTASTGMNDTSSRSHAIFTINFTQVSTGGQSW